MNGRPEDNDFEELEPRVTPQPTLLMCTTSPSVPEVSMIFGKPPIPIQDSKELRNTTNKDYETYAHWRKDEYPRSTIPKSDSRYPRQSFDGSSIDESPIHRKSTFNDTANFVIAINDEKFHNDNSPNQRKRIAVPDRNFDVTARNIDNTRLQNYERHSQNLISEFSSTTKKFNDSPVQKKSQDAVKSILKSSYHERPETSDSSTNYDRRAKKQLTSPAIPSSGDFSILENSRTSPILRRDRRHDVDSDRGTVRDLLELVKNQNEQIKSLQNQVERLLQAHEESIACRESRNSMTNNVNRDGYSSVERFDDEKISSNNGVTSQKTFQSRSTTIVPSNSSDDSTDVRSRYPIEQMRNAVVEKKVSIGVMTSFEFSVQNNPFVGDTDDRINAVLLECGKNINEKTDNWRSNNVCSRNVVNGQLENINEDSEGYPSSLWKQSNNTTQSSSNDRTNFKRNPTIVDANKILNDDENRGVCFPIYDNARRTNVDRDQTNFDRSSQPPIPAPRRFLSIDRKIGTIAGSSEMRTASRSDDRGSNDVVERETYDDHRRDNDANDRDRGAVENRDDFYSSNRRDNKPGNWERSKPIIKSMATDNTDEGSLVLSSTDLRVNERPPSPDPSIHVEMREYSSDEDDEKTKIGGPVGWTFYKNIVGQVNRILHAIPDTKDIGTNDARDEPNVRSENDGERDEAVDPVKLATLERLKMLGISYTEHSEFMGEHVQKKVTFDSSYCPRLDYQTTLPQSTNTVTESNTSMHMKALALKYLSDEQLAELAVQKQADCSGMKHKILNSVHGTNMSLATMNYLQRYCMVSGVNPAHAEGKEHINTIRQKKLKHVVMTKEVHAQPMPRHQTFNDSGTKKGPDNILDITTLKQQPKLM